MTSAKEELLEKSHATFLEICIGDFPMHLVQEYISEEITGYGTNVNEKILSQEDFISLLNLQREESQGIKMDFNFFPVSKTLMAQNNVAVFIDEARLTMTIEENQLVLLVRFSSVFEFLNEQWRAVHFHGSLAQGVEGDRDTWAVNEWKQKNEALEKIIKERTEELQLSLEHLKATQNQLIQSEKMASLGELTAGIAHEIQNPLNFVNNFSEVNTELINEASQEIKNGNISEVEIILNDIRENEQKILHHGKRADAIVKGMLQHSRTSNGQKELIDINALADEYLRLSYHGLRAKDKSFNADFKIEADDSLPKIEVVPQDIGRVLLNLINNAFYAVSEARSPKLEVGSKDYKPEVILSTKKLVDKIEIRVADNGRGIPQNIVEKIFQPFFTTKPTGQGTGLGLSLSYDIVKAHGGELKVETKEGEGSEFIIQLPIMV